MIISDKTNKKIIEDGAKLANDEACLSLKIFLGHVLNLKDKCDYILIPRLYCLEYKEQVCTNFNALYDLVNNVIECNILNYDIDLEKNNSEILAFINIGKILGVSYIRAYRAYKYAKNKEKMLRIEEEKKQLNRLNSSKIKVLLVGHPYNLYDDLIGKDISYYLYKNNIEVIYSDKMPHNLIENECSKISNDIHWTYSKELVAAANYYKDKVDGMIIISSFPCGPDSLSTELILHKIDQLPIINLIFDEQHSKTGVITRLESFIDILVNLKEKKYDE